MARPRRAPSPPRAAPPPSSSIDCRAAGRTVAPPPLRAAVRPADSRSAPGQLAQLVAARVGDEHAALLVPRAEDDPGDGRAVERRFVNSGTVRVAMNDAARARGAMRR